MVTSYRYPPPLAWLYGFAAGAMTYAYHLPVFLCITIVGCLGITVFFILPSQRKLCILSVLAFGLALPWCKMFLFPPWQHYLRQLPKERSGVSVKLRIHQGTIPLQGDVSPSKHPRITADILSLQTIDTTWIDSSGLLLLRGKAETMAELEKLQTGVQIEATGTILPPPAQDELYGFYGSYIKSIGIHNLLIVDSFTVKHSPLSFYDKMLRSVSKWRGMLATHLSKGLPDTPLSGLYIVLGTGINEYLPTSLRTSFLRSGTVHIFAISGLHVGIFLQISLILFKSLGLGLKPRFILCAFCTIGYATLTGLSPSSIRALLMALLAIYATLRFRPVSALYTVALAGSAALLANPLLVLHTGFLFSYSVVLILVSTWPVITTLNTILHERNFWIPARWRNRSFSARFLKLIKLDGFLDNLPATIAGSALAWLTSAGLATLTSSHLCLLSPLVNLPIGFLLLPVLLSIPLKILTALFFPTVNVWLAKIIYLLINALCAISDCAAFSPFSFAIRRITKAEIALYYISLTFFLCFLIFFCRKLLEINTENTNRPDT